MSDGATLTNSANDRFCVRMVRWCAYNVNGQETVMWQV